MAELECPHCGTTRQIDTIPSKARFRCPSCKNVFRLADPELDLRTILLEAKAPLPPPPQTPPFKRPPVRPKQELYGYHPMPIESSRKFMGAVGAIVLAGLIIFIGNWYSSQVRALEQMGRKAGDRHNAKIRAYADPKAVSVKPGPSRAPAVVYIPSSVSHPQSKAPRDRISHFRNLQNPTGSETGAQAGFDRLS